MRKLTAGLLEAFRRHLIEEEKAQTTVDQYLRDAITFTNRHANRRT